MSFTPKPGDERRSLPEDIAVSAGMPRGTLGEKPHQDQAASAAQGLADKAQDLHRKADDLRDQAADTANDLRTRATDTANDVRERVGETAQDLRARASERYEDARDWVAEARETGRQRIEDLGDRSAERFQDGKSAVEDFVSEHPLLVGVVGLAAGLLLGALLPRTRSEDRTVGPWADEVRDQGLRYARDVTHRGREFVASALDPDNLNAAVQRATDQPDTSTHSPAPSARPH